MHIPNTLEGRLATHSPLPDNRGGNAMALFDPAAFGRMLRRGAGTILKAVALALALALLYLLLVPPKYSGTAIVLVDPREQRVLRTEDVISGIGSDAAAVESQVEIIRSIPMMSAMIDRFTLMQDPEFSGPGLISSTLSLLGIKPADQSEEMARNKVMEKFDKALHVQRRGLTYVLEINFVSTDAKKAAAIATGIAEAYVRDVGSTKTDATATASEWLTQKLAALRTSVKDSEQAVAAFKADNSIFDVGSIGAGETLNQRETEAINQQLIAARARTAEARIKLDQVLAATANGGSIESVSQVMNSPVLTALRGQMSRLAQQEAQLGTTLQSGHPRLKAVRSQLVRIRGQMSAEIRRVAKNVQIEYDIAKNIETSLTGNLSRIKLDSDKQNALKVQLRALEREADANRNLYQQFLARAKETSQAKDLQRNGARLVSRALPPLRPTRPSAPVILLLASLAGLGAGIGTTLIKQNASGIAATAQRASNGAVNGGGLHMVAAIPALVQSSTIDRLKRSIAGGSASREDETGFSGIMNALADTRGSLNGPFRQGVLHLLGIVRARATNQQCQVVMIVSGETGGGASSLALGLAYAAALDGERVLLIDAASADADLSLALAGPLDQGRPCVLDNKAHLADLLTHDSGSGLALLPIALADLRLLKLPQRRQLATGIGKLAADYDLMFIDGGALLEDKAPLALMPATHHVIISGIAAETPDDVIDQTAMALDIASSKILGVVMMKA